MQGSEKIGDELRELQVTASALKEDVANVKQSLVELVAIMTEMNDAIQEAMGGG